MDGWNIGIYGQTHGNSPATHESLAGTRLARKCRFDEWLLVVAWDES